MSQSQYMELKATLNAASYEAITAALRPAAVVPAPPWCTWKQRAKMDKISKHIHE